MELMIRLLFSLVCLCCLAHSSLSAAEATERPNIIFIVADDLGYRDLGVYGSDDIETPNLDRFAETGSS